MSRSHTHTHTHKHTKDETRNFGCCGLFSLSIGSFGFLCPGSAKMKTLYWFRVDSPRIEQWLKIKTFSMQTHNKHTHTHTHTHTRSSPRFLTLIVVVDVVMDFYGADLILHLTHTHWQTSTHTSSISNTVLNCLNPFFVFYSFFLVHFFSSFCCILYR